jgi:hypothetical protein
MEGDPVESMDSEDAGIPANLVDFIDLFRQDSDKSNKTPENPSAPSFPSPTDVDHSLRAHLGWSQSFHDASAARPGPPQRTLSE